MPTADDFRRHYAELPDDALRAIQPADLVDTARDCWRAELVARGLELPGASGTEGGEETPLDPAQEFVALAEFADPADAHLAQAKLSAVQIGAVYVTGDKFSWQPRPTWVEDADGRRVAYRLAVPRAVLELAQEALASELSDEDLEAQALAAAPPEEAES